MDFSIYQSGQNHSSFLGNNSNQYWLKSDQCRPWGHSKYVLTDLQVCTGGMGAIVVNCKCVEQRTLWFSKWWSLNWSLLTSLTVLSLSYKIETFLTLEMFGLWVETFFYLSVFHYLSFIISLLSLPLSLMLDRTAYNSFSKTSYPCLYEAKFSHL
jgi:hypothetical protein